MDLRKLQAIKNITNLGAFGGSQRQAILAAGYSDKVSHNPKRITDSKWFKSAIPDHEETANALRDLIRASKLETQRYDSPVTDEAIVADIESIPGCKVRKITRSLFYTTVSFWSPDHKARKEAIDIAIKVRGDYAAVKVTNVDPYAAMSDEELEEELQKAEQEKKERMVNYG